MTAKVVHEKSYSLKYLGGFVHRSRLKRIKEILRRHLTEDVRSWADFGCSNGFIIERVIRDNDISFDRITGYDHSEELLEMARARNLENISFQYCDMSLPPLHGLQGDLYQMVTCLETLEHVADYHVSFEHLYASTEPGGVIIVAVPNETGLVGLIKLLARQIARRNPNEDFFADKSLAQYVKRLLSGGNIEQFRPSRPQGYGSHLGFDYRRLLEFVDSRYVVPGFLSVVEKSRTTFGMNIIVVYRVEKKG